jgi:hypothetical protein
LLLFVVHPLTKDSETTEIFVEDEAESVKTGLGHHESICPANDGMLTFLSSSLVYLTTIF